MVRGKGEVLEFAQLAREKREDSYHCFVTEGRLSGRCELLICEDGLRAGDLFSLYFSPAGLARRIHLSRRQTVGAWLALHACVKITYLQALGLLGDAVRQNYRYGTVNAACDESESVHLQRIWLEEYYSDGKSQLHWALEGQSFMLLLQAYLCALGNRDAVLLYDMTAQRARDKWGRGMYAFCWGHALEGLRIFDFELSPPGLRAEDLSRVPLYLTVYGVYPDHQVLSVDLRLQFVLESGNFRIAEEHILEARIVCPRQLQQEPAE